ncbi:zinc ribbon domain-containing protein [Eubacterium barkeri]|uniref:Putative zinc-ribbon domain-containing protein n=1 Tax=Eubacterium barkeri TaxID=1528 RepID=A0A1H3G850_EUBBA|nr:zinc ribbon domain-containing protein [Eubacterium barkeri]SDX99441.1 hypothetical protein SAMN04488579_11311 [Eubacterium barkeri]
MKQALTASGSLSIWFDSAKEALNKMGISYQVNEEEPSIIGQHGDMGPIQIDFKVPVEGKTRMEITVQNPELINGFKRAVAPEYKSLLAMSVQQKETELAAPPELPPQQEEEKPTGPVESEETETEVLGTTDEIPQSADNREEVTEVLDQSAEEQTHIIPEEETAPIIEKTQKERRCKACGAFLDNQDKVCPECGKKQGNGGLIAMIIVGAVIIVGAIGFMLYTFVFSGQRSNTSTNTPTTTPSTTVTQPTTTSLVTNAQFEQIQNGMTYADVVGIFGRDGTLLSESTFKDESGNDVQLKIYYWEGQGEAGANASVSFQGDVVVTKSSYGLQ